MNERNYGLNPHYPYNLAGLVHLLILCCEWRRRDEKKRLNHLKQDQEEEHPKCCQAKGSKDEEKLVHLKMVVKFKVLIEKKRMCYLGLMRFDWWMLVFDGAFRGVGDEEVVVREGVVMTSSSLEMLTNICLGGIMVSLIFLEGLEEYALVNSW
nr:hypothetical protein [Tanacetum cinerariifolium]